MVLMSFAVKVARPACLLEEPYVRYTVCNAGTPSSRRSGSIVSSSSSFIVGFSYGRTIITTVIFSHPASTPALARLVFALDAPLCWPGELASRTWLFLLLSSRSSTSPPHSLDHAPHFLYSDMAKPYSTVLHHHPVQTFWNLWLTHPHMQSSSSRTPQRPAAKGEPRLNLLSFSGAGGPAPPPPMFAMPCRPRQFRALQYYRARQDTKSFK